MFKNLLTASLILLSVSSCQQATPVASNAADAKRMQEYDRQTAKVSEQQIVADEQLKRSELQQQRMEALVQRWEQQADRYDKILSAWEKRGAVLGER